MNFPISDKRRSERPYALRKLGTPFIKLLNKGSDKLKIAFKVKDNTVGFLQP